tara:strand:+ start:534 stop:932 length:399 start_codon:yes stop_codon:yes gene_type:complete
MNLPQINRFPKQFNSIEKDYTMETLDLLAKEMWTSYPHIAFEIKLSRSNNNLWSNKINIKLTFKTDIGNTEYMNQFIHDLEPILNNFLNQLPDIHDIDERHGTLVVRDLSKNTPFTNENVHTQNYPDPRGRA